MQDTVGQVERERKTGNCKTSARLMSKALKIEKLDISEWEAKVSGLCTLTTNHHRLSINEQELLSGR